MGNGFCKDCCQSKEEGNILIQAGNKLEKSKIIINKIIFWYIAGDKIADKIDDLTHPNETKTEKFMRKTGEFFEKTKNEIKNSCGC